MSSILLLICGLTFLIVFAFGDLNSKGDGLSGLSQKNLEEYVTKALQGFKNVMLKGDEELNYPILDPYTLEDVSWEYTDTSGSKKYSVNFFNKNSTKIHGLSNYEVEDVEVNAKEMILSFNLILYNVQTEISYKLDGYMFKGMMPLYGEGVLTLSSPTQRFNIMVGLDTVNGYIVVDLIDTDRYDYDINVKVSNFMDLPGKFADYAVDDILDRIMEQHAVTELRTFVQNTVEEAVGGMTMKEFVDFLDHVAKKSDQL